MRGAPVWLLDVDGVLNAISPEPDVSVWPIASWVRAEAPCTGVTWPLLVAQPVLDFVRHVHRAGLAEIRWHTTWQGEVTGVARALHLPYFPVQPSEEFASYQEQQVGGAAPAGARWWKLPAAQRVVGVERRALVWTDDDVDIQLHQHGRRHPFLDVPSVLAVSPRTHIGLSRRHLHIIDSFLREPPKDLDAEDLDQPAQPDLPESGAVTQLAG